jgi:hypothetical protein
MASRSLGLLRVIVPILLFLLAIQYEFGMAVNLAGPSSIAPFGFSPAGVSAALSSVGATLWIHALLGTVLVVFSLASLLVSTRSGLTTVQAFGVLAFLTTALAATAGLLFVLSGYQNNGDSHGMATNFLLAFSFYFLELYFLKAGSNPGDREPR